MINKIFQTFQKSVVLADVCYYLNKRMVIDQKQSWFTLYALGII